MIKFAKIDERYVKGFTLLEMLVTIAVFAIIISIALPSYSDFTRKQNLKISTKVLNKAFATARVEAITSDDLSSVVCWNLTAMIDTVQVDGDDQEIAPGEIMVALGTLGALTEVVSVNQILSAQQRAIVTDNDDNDDCVSFDAQGRLLNSDEFPLGFLVCRAPGDDLESLRVEVANSGRATVKSNTNTTGWGTQGC